LDHTVGIHKNILTAEG